MATVPIFPSLGDALTALAPGASLEARRSVGGGDINRAYRLTLSDRTELFAKANASSLLPMFEAEAEGLAAMRATGTIGVTEVLGIGLEPEAFGQDSSFLLLAWLEPASKRADFWETFAEELAAMHAADTAFLFPERGGQTTYGFPIDNYIGSTPQTAGTGPPVPSPRRPVGRQLHDRPGRESLAHRPRNVCGTPGGGPSHDGTVRRVLAGILLYVPVHRPRGCRVRRTRRPLQPLPSPEPCQPVRVLVCGVCFAYSEPIWRMKP